MFYKTAEGVTLSILTLTIVLLAIFLTQGELVKKLTIEANKCYCRQQGREKYQQARGEGGIPSVSAI